MPVNDAPELNFADHPDLVFNNNLERYEIFWTEDQEEIQTLDLNQFLIDVDDNDSTDIGWLIVIEDTSQLDEDFPLGRVISGPNISSSMYSYYTRKIFRL